MTPIERLREAAAVPADDVTVSRTDLAAVLERIDATVTMLTENINSCRSYDEDGEPLTDGPFPCEAFCENFGHHSLIEILTVLGADHA